jgi:hypothetical protein
MSDVYIEIKGVREPEALGSRAPAPQKGNHCQDNLVVTPTTSWVSVGVAGLGAGSLVVYNSGVVTVGVALGSPADTDRYHVVPAGGQRELYVSPDSDIWIRDVS